MRLVGTLSTQWHPRALKLTASAGALALAAGLLAPEPAEARKKPQQNNSGYFSFFDAPPPPSRPYRVYNRRTQKPPTSGGTAATKEAAPAEAPIKGPLVISVSLGQQRLTVFDSEEPIAEAPISSGTAAFPTLQGVFTILEKSKIHYSNLYNSAPMPNMQRITWSGTAMHAGVLPGYPASHGCIRLPHNFSKKLFGMTKLGTRVIVSRDLIVPKAFAHPNLIAPLPAESVAADASSEQKPVRDYESVRALTMIASASAAETEASPPVSALTGYRAKRAAEKQRTEEALQAAEAGKLAAESDVKAAVAEAEKAKADARAANTEAALLAQETRKAENARQEGDRAIVAFEKKYASAGTLRSDMLEKASAAEQQLEDKTFELGRALDAARAAGDDAKRKAEEADRTAEAAVGKTKDLAKKLADLNTEIRTAREKLDSFKKQELVRKLPVSVLISRSAGRLYVRQGYQPIFDVPVTLKDPETAIGTHVFTALEQTAPTEMRWSASTIPYTPPAPTAKKSKRNPQYDVAPVSMNQPQTPAAALDRVTIPEEARERIADVMKVGSSIIVSDYGISHQTGSFTDFILLTR